jgi:hypothetical protein
MHAVIGLEFDVARQPRIIIIIIIIHQRIKRAVESLRQEQVI